MTDNDIRKTIVGILAFLMLGTAMVLWLTGFAATRYTLYFSLCCKVGPVLLLLWLAWNQLVRLPQWAFISVPIVLVALVINRKLVLLAIPLAAMLSFLNHPWLKRRPPKK